jgi:hypothetical protein
MAKDLLKFHKKQVRMLAYHSRKHVPTKKGTMYFGTWIDSDGEYFDTATFLTILKTIHFRVAVATFARFGGSGFSFPNHHHFKDGENAFHPGSSLFLRQRKILRNSSENQ